MKLVLTDKEIGAGTEPASGLPELHLDGLEDWGFKAPNHQRYKMCRETARKVGAQLLLAADPELAGELLEELARRADRRARGLVLPEIPAGVAAFVVDPGLLPVQVFEADGPGGSYFKVIGEPYAYVSSKASGRALEELRKAIDAELDKRRENTPQEVR